MIKGCCQFSLTNILGCPKIKAVKLHVKNTLKSWDLCIEFFVKKEWPLVCNTTGCCYNLALSTFFHFSAGIPKWKEKAYSHRVHQHGWLCQCGEPNIWRHSDNEGSKQETGVSLPWLSFDMCADKGRNGNVS